MRFRTILSDSSTSASVPRKTNLKITKILLSVFVFLSHMYILAGVKFLSFMSFTDIEMRVQSFFVISGFFLYLSYKKTTSVSDFLKRRMERLYPPYCAAIMFTLLIGLIWISASQQKIDVIGILKYTIFNLLTLNFIAPNIPGLFTDNPIPAANGALWTMKVELSFCAAIPLLFFFSRWVGFFTLLISTYVASSMYYIYMKHTYLLTGNSIYEVFSRQPPGQLRFLVAGILFCVFIEKFRAMVWEVRLVVILFSVGIVWFREDLQVLYPPALATIIFSLVFAPYLSLPDKLPDISYGIYLYHFPIIQLSVALGVAKSAPLVATLSCAAATIFMALVSRRIELTWWAPSNSRPTRQMVEKSDG
ncbi:acyltransferase family protein [Agrobacterium larrymoorei]|uniref:acyltransferase family protein n=1 Tax=Agrobacterium larrymoorei TaxID=160699 RepID=UPI0030C53B7F